MRFPERLNQGDIIGMISPSGPVEKEQIDLCKFRMEELGYKVKLGRYIYNSIHGYSAGTGEEKAYDINSMFSDNEVKAIWCIRGGDTSSHTMDKIDFDLIKNNPKIFIGYSDITNLHVAFNQKCELITFHGPMVKSNVLNDYDEFTRESLEAALNMVDELILKNPEGEDFKTLIGGKAEGTIVGGNLSLLTSMIGTPYEVDTRNKILFIEDIEEEVRRIDRMMYQLKYSGKLNDSVGIIIGDFMDCPNKADENYTVIDLLREVLSDYNKPVIYNVKSGHCYPMSTIPLGANCIINNNIIKFNLYKSMI